MANLQKNLNKQEKMTTIFHNFSPSANIFCRYRIVYYLCSLYD